MVWLKPTHWLAVLCHFIAAQHFWVALLAAILGMVGFYGLRDMLVVLTAQQSMQILRWLGVWATWLVWILIWLWPVIMLGVGLSGIWKRWYAERLYRRLQHQSHHGFENVSWQDFEILVGEVFRRYGFEVQVQGGDHADGGIDVIVRRDGGTYLVQCKHWQAQRVGVKVVRELYGVIAAEGMDGGYVVTSGMFTPDAVDFSQGIAMQLINGRQLTSLLDGELEL